MRKRIIGLVLVMSMLISVMPLAVHAEVSGECGKYGDNLTWTLDDDGTLTISGNGEMEDWYVFTSEPPWNSEDERIKKVIIKDGVTSIGDEAFLMCSNLADIEIPDSVERIGDSAISGGRYLTDIKIPAGVKTMGYMAISSFWLKSITVDENNQNFSSEDGVLFDKDKTELISYPRAKAGTEYVIPESVKRIGDAAFSCTDITDITIPQGVTYIGENAFNGTDITSIEIPDSVTHIDDLAFQNCHNLTSVEIPNGVTYIGSDVFAYCKGLTNITIPDSAAYIGRHLLEDTPYYSNEDNWDNDALYIGKHLIKVKRETDDITIRENTITIADEAFGGCKYLESVTLPAGLENINGRAFGLCGSLKISVAEGNPYYSAEDGILFNKDKTELVAYAQDRINPVYKIPYGIERIGNCAFFAADGIEQVTIPETVQYIGESAFESCDRLRSVTIPDGVERIEDGTFYWCNGMTDITIPKSVKSIGSFVFWPNYPDDVYYSGSEEEWNNVDIYKTNDYFLLYASVHYNSPGAPLVFAGDPDLSVDNGEYIFDMQIDTVNYESTLIIALYSNGVLTGIKSTQISPDNVPDTITVAADTADMAKMFVWNDLNCMEPLCVEKFVVIQ